MTLSHRLSNGLQSTDNSSMKAKQTSQNRLHPPAHAGTATGGIGSGIFAPMKTPKEYEIEIESLRAMNLKLQLELTKALEAFASEYIRSMAAAEILDSNAA